MTYGTHGPQCIHMTAEMAWNCPTCRPNMRGTMQPIADEMRKAEKMNGTDTSPEAVERFTPVPWDIRRCDMMTDVNGEWVQYDDYRALSARVAEYEVRLRELEARCLHLSKGEARLSGLLNERATELACAEQRAATLEERYLAVVGDKINLRGEVATLEAERDELQRLLQFHSK